MVVRRYVDVDAPNAAAPADPPEAARLLDAIGRRMLMRRVDALKSLPAFPESIVRIQQVMIVEAPDASFQRIAAVIEADPVLTARILKLVNSAFYDAGGVVTVLDALVMLGLDVVKGLILSTHAMDMMRARASARGLWEHSFGAAVAAGCLGRVLGMDRLEEASAAALMHDIGKVVAATQLAEDYADVIEHAACARVTTGEAELALLGVRHEEIGRWLVTRWRLPAALAEPIACHHAPESARRFPEATALVHVADQIVRGLGFGFPGDGVMPEFSEAAWRILGLTGLKLSRAVEQTFGALRAALVTANLT